MRHIKLFETFNDRMHNDDTDGFIEITPDVRKQRLIQWESNDPSYYWKNGRIELYYDTVDKYIGLNIDGVDFATVSNVDDDTEANRIGKILTGEFSMSFNSMKDRDNAIALAKKQGINLERI